MWHDITNSPKHYEGRREGSECSRRGSCGQVYIDWHLIMSVVFTHVSLLRPKVHEGAAGTLLACGIGSSLAPCVPEAQRFVTLWPMSQ